MTEAVAEPTLDQHLAAAEAPAVAEPVIEPAAEPVVAPVSEPADDDAPDDEAVSEAGKTLAKGKKTARERIAELTWRQQQQSDRADRAEAELAALRKPTEPAKPGDDGKPKLKAFTEKIGTTYETYEDATEAFTDALTDWKDTARQQASTADAATRAYQDALHHSSLRGTAAHADFDAIMQSFVESGRMFTPFMQQAILGDPDTGHELAYLLATDPASYQALASAPTLMAATKVLGKLLTRFDGAPPSASPSKPAPLTRAQPPITPVGSSPQAADSGPADPDDLDAHILRENAREARERAAGRR